MIKRLVKIALIFAALLFGLHFTTYAYINKAPTFPDPDDKVKHWYLAYDSYMSTR